MRNAPGLERRGILCVSIRGLFLPWGILLDNLLIPLDIVCFLFLIYISMRLLVTERTPIVTSPSAPCLPPQHFHNILKRHQLHIPHLLCLIHAAFRETTFGKKIQVRLGIME